MVSDVVRGIISNVVGLGLLAGIGYALNVLPYAGVSAGVNYLVFFAHALPQDSEKFFDATGTVAYVSMVVTCVIAEGVDLTDFSGANLRRLVLSVMALTWSLRLGSYLLARILRAGKDSRFEVLRATCLRWLGVWTIQAVWCFLVICPVLVVVKKVDCSDSIIGEVECKLTPLDFIGWPLWVLSFLFEVVADRQKVAFRADPANKGRFICTGLWSRSRHPNYVGEIMMWVGITMSATSVLVGWDFFAYMSPLTTYMLLTRVSGVNLLEAQGQERWGEDAEYRWYVDHVPVLWPALSAPPSFDKESAGVALQPPRGSALQQPKIADDA